MPRPRLNTDLAHERRLSYTICYYIYSESGRTFSELEEFFGIGAEHQTKKVAGKRSGRDFARYCFSPELDPRGRTASRDMLCMFLTKSMHQGWIKPEFARRYAQYIAVNPDSFVLSALPRQPTSEISRVDTTSNWLTQRREERLKIVRAKQAAFEAVRNLLFVLRECELVTAQELDGSALPFDDLISAHFANSFPKNRFQELLSAYHFLHESRVQACDGRDILPSPIQLTPPGTKMDAKPSKEVIASAAEVDRLLAEIEASLKR